MREEFLARGLWAFIALRHRVADLGERAGMTKGRQAAYVPQAKTPHDGRSEKIHSLPIEGAYDLGETR